MKFIDAASVGESLISSYNIYIDTGMKRSTETKEPALVMKHINSGEHYYAVRMKSEVIGTNTAADIRMRWRQLIKRPVFEYFRWPVDIMVKDNVYYLIYDIIPTVNYKSLAELCQDKDYLGLDKKKIRNITINFINAFLSIYKKQYLFFGLDDDYIFIDQDNDSVLINMYTSIYIKRNAIVFFEMQEYFSEVIDPYSYENRSIDPDDVNKDKYTYDTVSEHYAFASLLFRLMIGLYPFEGPNMAAYTFDPLTENNRNWIYHYLQTAIFIFDEENKNNSIANLNRFEDNVNRWNMLTERLQTMFRRTFSQRNVYRTEAGFSGVPLYTVSDWKDAVEELFLKEFNEVVK